MLGQWKEQSSHFVKTFCSPSIWPPPRGDETVAQDQEPMSMSWFNREAANYLNMHINLKDRVESLLADLKEPVWGNRTQRWGLWEMAVLGRHSLMIQEDNLCYMDLAHAELIWGSPSFNMLMCTWTRRSQRVDFLTSVWLQPICTSLKPLTQACSRNLSVSCQDSLLLPGSCPYIFIPPHIFHEGCQVHVTWPRAPATPVFPGLLQNFYLFIYFYYLN